MEKLQKYRKNQKKWGWLVMMLGGVLRVHCIFPYMEGEAMLNIKIPIKGQ